MEDRGLEPVPKRSVLGDSKRIYVMINKFIQTTHVVSELVLKLISHSWVRLIIGNKVSLFDKG